MNALYPTVSFLFLFSVIFALLSPSPALSQAGCNNSSACSLPPSLFISREQLAQIKSRIAEDTLYESAFERFSTATQANMSKNPDPFFMENVGEIEFGWCGSAGGDDDSLKDLVEKLTIESSIARDLALLYLLTGNTEYAGKSRQYLLAWAQNSTLVNFYDFNINFQSATFDGMEQGFCNNSWNMALDSIWQAYGLINFSDVYLILSRNGYTLSDSEKTTMAEWLRAKLLPATNAGFHAWTRWADGHTASSAYERYRSDNHLSWSLAGIAAAAAALNDDALWSYAYQGGTFDDGRSGSYANPSNFESLVGWVVDENGRVFDETARASEHKGISYGNFNLWALSLVAQIAEVHKAKDYWTFEGNGTGSLAKAFDYYARYTAGDLDIPDPEETTDPAFYRFMYEMLVGNSWVTGSRLDLYTRARNSGARNQVIQQSIGPVSLLTGDLPEQTGPNPLRPRKMDRPVVLKTGSEE